MNHTIQKTSQMRNPDSQIIVSPHPLWHHSILKSVAASSKTKTLIVTLITASLVFPLVQ